MISGTSKILAKSGLVDILSITKILRAGTFGNYCWINPENFVPELFIGNHGKLWKSMENHWKLWENQRKYFSLLRLHICWLITD